MSIKSYLKSKFSSVKLTKQDTIESLGVKGKGETKKVLPYELKATYQTRLDMKLYNEAINMAQADEPYNYAIQLMYDNISRDALLTSQYENRKGQIFSLDFNLLKPDGTPDEEQSKFLKKHALYRFFTHQSLDSIFKAISLVELSISVDINGKLILVGDSLPRTNIVQQRGLFYPDYSDPTKSIPYRDLPEFGTWILEFNSKDLGLLNKAVPHVLFKRFAQSCWSELCEIYGIPPRVLTTNTQDKTMLDRASKMMKDMGAAAWFIIDEEEKFEWAQGVSTNGDVYKNLIELCRDELCLLIVGAIIGQNTSNGSNAKDKAAQEMLWLLVQSDMAMVTEHWNNIIIPALVKHGLLQGELTFEFVPTEDKAQLVDWSLKFLEYYDIDLDWLKKKTGIEFTKQKETPQPSTKKDKSNKLSYKGSKPFFDPAPRD